MNKGSAITPTVSYEQGLWKSFQLGNQQALATIYSIYFDHLYNYGFKFTRDATLVEDCIQELFIRLIRNGSRLAVPDSLKNYLFTAFRNHLFDKMASLKKKSTREIQESAEFELQLAEDPDILSGEADQEAQKKLSDALGKLTPRQREAIFLRYQQGFSYPEIATMLSLNQKSTYKLIARAIQVLRESSILLVIAGGAWFLSVD